MGDFSISGAIGTGFGLITQRPLAVLLWGVLPALVFIPLILLFGGSLLAIVIEVTRAGADRAAAAQAVLAGLGGVFLFIILSLLATWVLGAVISAAGFRAVLHPEQSSFGYLRFGGRELTLMLVSLVTFFVFLGVGIVVAIPTSIIQLSAMGSSMQTRAILQVVLTLIRQAITLWVWLRLCMGMPMSFAEGRFRLFESWALTRGHTLKLLGFVVLAFLIVAVVECVALALGAGALFGFAGGAITALQGGDPATLATRVAALGGAFVPAVVVWALLGVVVFGIANALTRAPLAAIYRELAGADATAVPTT